MKPTFLPQDLKKAAEEAQAQVSALDLEVARLEQWAQEIQQSESGVAETHGEVERLQAEVLNSLNDVPEALESKFAELITQAKEQDQAEAEAAEKKPDPAGAPPKK
jgi:hypothetical protein